MSSDIAPIDALACVEEEIHQQAVSLFNLRPKRKSFSPVFRLPSETLEIIFIHGARNYHESDSGGHFTPRIPNWVNVSYVCSHWRNIALNCPTLWTYHFNTSLRWTEELLLRSKEASLKISCFSREHGGIFPWSSLLDKLLKHSKRIQELRLDIWLSFIPAKLSLCAARLEKLEICLRWGIPEQSITITDGDKLPLRTLKLDNCLLPWYSLNLSGLKELVLLYDPSPSPLNMVEFLSILSSMHNLTLLHLEGVFPSARDFLSSGGLDVSPQVNLPHLALLAVSAPLSTVVALLSCVNIPPRTRLVLDPLFEPGSSVGDYVPISSFLAQQFSAREQSSGLIFRSLVLRPGHSLTFSSLEYDCHAFSLFKQPDHDIPLDVTFRAVEDEDMEEMGLTLSDIHRIMSDICRSLPLTNVQSLYVNNPHFLSSDFWSEMLGRLDGLRYMKLMNGRMPDLSMLSLAAREPKENSDWKQTQDSALDRILVPALEEMELDHITFAHGQSRMSETSLFETLSTRKRLRDRVTMTECNSTC